MEEMATILAAERKNNEDLAAELKAGEMGMNELKSQVAEMKTKLRSELKGEVGERDCVSLGLLARIGRICGKEGGERER